MSDRMLGKMSKYMSEYMTWNARVGITRSKVIIFHSVGKNNPNWRTHIFQRVKTTNQIKNPEYPGILLQSVNPWGFSILFHLAGHQSYQPVQVRAWPLRGWKGTTSQCLWVQGKVCLSPLVAPDATLLSHHVSSCLIIRPYWCNVSLVN